MGMMQNSASIPMALPLQPRKVKIPRNALSWQLTQIINYEFPVLESATTCLVRVTMATPLVWPELP